MPLVTQRGRTNQPARICVTGVGGVGKTTFAGDFPDPIFLDAEDGSHQLEVARFIFDEKSGRTTPETFDEVLWALDQIASEDHKFKTLVIDTLNAVEQLIHAKVKTEGGLTHTKFADFATGTRASLLVWDEFLVAIDRVRARHRMEVVLICHTEVKVYTNPIGPDYDKFVLKLGGRETGPKIIGWCDSVLFCTDDTAFKEAKKTGKAKIQGNISRRVMYTEETPAWNAKNRWGLPHKLPLAYASFSSARREVDSPDVVNGLREQILEVSAQVCDAEKLELTRKWLEEGQSTHMLRVFLNKLNVMHDEISENGEDSQEGGE